MKKLLNKILVLTLALTVAFATVGCGGGNDDSGNSGDGSPNTSVVQPLEPSITMTPSLSLILGETMSANVSAKNCDGDVNYTSDNENVAIFKNGSITAVGEGTTTVTASYGTATASCSVIVSYGNYRPSLQLNSNLSNSTTIGYEKTYDILPYVSFNKAVYEDATFEYEVEDNSIISVSNDGIITGLKTGSTKLTINTTWRDFTSKENVEDAIQTDSLSATYNVTVRDNVAFYDNDLVLSAKTINTPASFQTEYNNVYQIKPTVIVNDGAPVTLTSDNVTIKSVAGVSGDDYYEWNPDTLTLTANEMGSVIVEVKYEYGQNEYNDNYKINFERPAKTLEETVELFSAKVGTYKVKVPGGYENKNLEFAAWGRDVDLVDAYQNGNSLMIEGDAIIGVEVNHDTTTDTVIVLGTTTEIYEIPVNAAMYFISEALEVKDALQRIDDPVVETGYHLLLNDIDMEGVVIDNRIHGYNAEVYSLYDSNGNLVTSRPRDIMFNGVFDGNGYVIYNATTELVTKTNTLYTSYDPFTGNVFGVKHKNVQAYGLFHIIGSSAVIKDVAFVNLKGLGTEANTYGLVAPLTWTLKGTVQNCYINVSRETPTTRGAFGVIDSSAFIKNTVIHFPMQAGYNFVDEAQIITKRDLNAWGYGSLGHNVGSALKYPSNYFGNYVISEAPLYFGTAGNTGILDDTTASGAIYYGENETELFYPYKAFDEIHGKVAHTVQSTEGEHKEEFGKVVKTGKTRVVSRFQRYDNYQALAESTYEGVAEFNRHYINNEFWVVSGNVPIWHSLTDVHNANFYATINNKEDLVIDCYDSQAFDVKLYGGSVENLVLTENSDLIEILEGNIIKGIKIGDGAVVNATFDFNGKQYSRTYTVNVADPFYFNDGADDFLAKTTVLEGEDLTLSVMINGTLIENATWSSTSTQVSITGNKLTGVKFTKDVIVKANFTYEGTDYERSFVLEVLDPFVENAVITIAGEVYDGETPVNVVIDGDKLALEIVSGTSEITSVSVNDPNGLISYEDGKLGGNLYGETTLEITFVIGGENHVTTVKAVTERQIQVVDTPVDFDSYAGVILSTVIDNSGVATATITYGDEDPFVLTTENGGIDVNGKLRTKVSSLDSLPGFPYISNKDFSESPVLNVEIGTNKKIYKFTNVTFWTSIIDDANEFKAALDIEYVLTGTTATTNFGFYKLANDIDMTGVKFAYTNAAAAFTNQNYEAGFAGQFDGCGYAIKNAQPGAYGLFGNLTIGGSNYPKVATVIENVAITNFKSEIISNGYSGYGAVLARYANCNARKIIIENIYVSYADDSPVNGIIGYVNKVNMNNILVDTDGNTVAPGSVLAGAEYGADIAGKAITFNQSATADGGALFANTRFFNPANVTTANINNVVTYGKAPVIYQWGYGVSYSNLWQYDTSKGWTMKNSGTLQPYLTIETYYGFAGNQEKGDIPMMTGMKDGFAALTKGKSSTSVAGYVCTTCGEVFSTTEGTCDTCKVALTKFSNLWTTPWSFTWKLLDIASHENTMENGTYKNGIYVLDGVSKYNNADEMSAAYTANNEVFASFTGEAGNGMWTVTEGVLTWKGAQA